MVTLRDIAAKARVSIATTSLALANHDVDPKTKIRRVSLKTGRRIRRIARRLEYQPNILARGIRKKQTFMIGLVVNSIRSSFYADIIEGVTNEIESKGYHLIICNSAANHRKETGHLLALERKQIDGIMVAPVLTAVNSGIMKVIGRIKDRPVLFLGVNPFRHPLAVTIDEVDSARQATQHLLGLGHRFIGYVPAALDRPHRFQEVMKWLPVALRYHGYEAAMTGNGLGARMVLSEREFLGLTRKRRLTAVVASTDEVAGHLYPVLARAGLRIPRDVSVVGIGDEPVTAWLVPPLTSMAPPKVELGRLAARHLLQAIEKVQGASVMLPARLVERASCRRLRENERGEP